MHLVAEPTRPDDGGVLVAHGPRRRAVRLAMLPFVSKRGIVRAAELMAAEAFENAQRYSERLRLLIEAMCAPFDADTVNVLAAHAFVLGAVHGRRRAAGPPGRRVRRDRAVVPGDHRLRRARPPPPGPANPRRAAPALLRLAAAARLRRGRADQAGQRRHLEPGVPADVRAVRLDGRPAAAHACAARSTSSPRWPSRATRGCG